MRWIGGNLVAAVVWSPAAPLPPKFRSSQAGKKNIFPSVAPSNMKLHRKFYLLCTDTRQARALTLSFTMFWLLRERREPWVSSTGLFTTCNRPTEKWNGKFKRKKKKDPLVGQVVHLFWKQGCFSLKQSSLDFSLTVICRFGIYGDEIKPSILHCVSPPPLKKTASHLTLGRSASHAWYNYPWFTPAASLLHPNIHTGCVLSAARCRTAGGARPARYHDN